MLIVELEHVIGGDVYLAKPVFWTIGQVKCREVVLRWTITVLYRWVPVRECRAYRERSLSPAKW